MKTNFIVLSIAVVGAVLMVVALRSNPTADEAARHYAVMEHDFGQLIAPGDELVSSSGNSKYGGAYLTKSIRWSGRTFSTYEEKAARLGWKKMTMDATQYCKDRMLFVVNQNGRSNAGENVLYMEMSFDAASVRTCDAKKVQSGAHNEASPKK